MKVRKVLIFVLIVGILWNMSISAESISVKLRGKLALVGILSGVAFLTHTLVKRDMQTTEKMRYQLGRPERIIQFERGFDNWNFHYYNKHYYVFLNDRFIRKEVRVTSFPIQTSHDNLNNYFAPNYTSNWNRIVMTNVVNRTFSVRPMWLSPFLLHQQKDPQFVSFYPHLSEAERLQLQRWLHPRLMLQK